jgi:hypothetical protein
MTLDCNKYRIPLDATLRLIKGRLEKGESPRDVASSLCMMTSIPIAVCQMYVLRPEVHGPDAELEANLKSVMDFYGYDDIVPFI